MKRFRLPDEQLVNAFQSDNSADSFEVLYNRYVKKIYQKCLLITKDSEVAQDYTQDIFIKVFHKLDTFQKQAAFSTWLYSITRNYCLDQVRVSKRIISESLSDTLSETVAELEKSDSGEHPIQTLETILNQLPAEDIDLLRLKYEQGLSIQDLCHQYNLSESAIKMRLKRSRDKLKKLYLNYSAD